MEAEVIADLRCKLKETEEERRKAAQYGLQLVESQNELQSQLDKCRNEMMTLTEVGHYTPLLTSLCFATEGCCCPVVINIINLIFFFSENCRSDSHPSAGK